MTIETLIEKLREDISWLGYNETERRIIDHIKCAITLLKDQEAIRPEWSNGKAFCGKCGKPFPRNRGEQRRFCSYCGHEVKWDDI